MLVAATQILQLQLRFHLISQTQTKTGRKAKGILSENLHCAAHIHPHHTESLICKHIKYMLNITIKQTTNTNTDHLVQEQINTRVKMWMFKSVCAVEASSPGPDSWSQTPSRGTNEWFKRTRHTSYSKRISHIKGSSYNSCINHLRSKPVWVKVCDVQSCKSTDTFQLLTNKPGLVAADTAGDVSTSRHKHLYLVAVFWPWAETTLAAASI